MQNMREKVRIFFDVGIDKLKMMHGKTNKKQRYHPFYRTVSLLLLFVSFRDQSTR